jgi:hypothetical protein
MREAVQHIPDDAIDSLNAGRSQDLGELVGNGPGNGQTLLLLSLLCELAATWRSRRAQFNPARPFPLRRCG